MAKMYPQNIGEYKLTGSEQLVYNELKRQLPDSFEVFYSVTWSTKSQNKMEKSEADFVILSPDYGYLCLEVKGGNGIYVEDNTWYLIDNMYGNRKLHCSPYEQAEKSMYYFKNAYSKAYAMSYQGIFAAGVVFPLFNMPEIEQISNRNVECTIDASDMTNLYNKITQMYRVWGGQSYGKKPYRKNQHETFRELIKKRVAISAAAGALVKYKEAQLEIINRVQDNYIYFLSNIRQFYVRGGAGTGKTWIAMKLADLEAGLGNRVLFLCASNSLAKWIYENSSHKYDVKSIEQALGDITDSMATYFAPLFKGISESINMNKLEANQYDAIFIDEAQDFSEELAYVAKMLLKDENTSRLGVFYDDVQIFREESFGDAFMISTPPFLLRENIRNTSNIYQWAMDNTDLGRDVVVNPVEGPVPHKEVVRDKKHLVQRIESLLKEYIIAEELPNEAIVLLVDDLEWFYSKVGTSIATWEFHETYPREPMHVRVSSVENYKGLEADMVIYIHAKHTSQNTNYIAYTRAKYYLIELINN